MPALFSTSTYEFLFVPFSFDRIVLCARGTHTRLDYFFQMIFASHLIFHVVLPVSSLTDSCSACQRQCDRCTLINHNNKPNGIRFIEIGKRCSDAVVHILYRCQAEPLIPRETFISTTIKCDGLIQSWVDANLGNVSLIYCNILRPFATVDVIQQIGKLIGTSNRRCNVQIDCNCKSVEKVAERLRCCYSD